jgi:hypothetical protein
VNAVQETLLWLAIAIAPGNRVHAYDYRTNTYYTVESYKFEGDYLWADRETILDIRKWGPQQPYEQLCIRYKKDVLSPLRPARRVEERYDGQGREILDTN